MASDFTIPDGMVPVTALANPVEVLTDFSLKTDEEGHPKRNRNAANCFGYSARIEATLGFRIKKLEGGETYNIPILKEFPLTVWSQNPVDISAGSYVRLENCAAGIVQGNIYLWASGVQPIEVPA